LPFEHTSMTVTRADEVFGTRKVNRLVHTTVPLTVTVVVAVPTRSSGCPLPARTTAPLQLAVQRIRQFQHNTIHHASLPTPHAAHHPLPSRTATRQLLRRCGAAPIDGQKADRQRP
jgi:hypothetical protein